MKSRGWTVAFWGGPERKDGGISGDAMVVEMGLRDESDVVWIMELELVGKRLICIRGGELEGCDDL